MKRVVIYRLVVVSCSMVAVCAQDPGNGQTAAALYVTTNSGTVHGMAAEGVEKFLGVPYAAPPLGELRWKPPVPAPRWAGVREATKLGSQCIQPVMWGARSQTIAGSEDCLYLNIYRPAQPASSPLPVLIFIHGGSNQKGSGNDYDPSEMVRKTGNLVVTINYRLNVFGFLALPSLDAELGDPSSGNYGVMDQQAAMQWVKTNIRAFGGSPMNVTIEGESAGGIDVCANLVSPSAAGLFTRAILESMYCPTASHDEAIKVSQTVVGALGCTDSQTAAACLRSKAPVDVLNATKPLSFAPGGGQGFNASPNFGGKLLPRLPEDAFHSGQRNTSSILIGSNHDEAALFVVAGLLARGVKMPLSTESYRVIVSLRYGGSAREIFKEYPLEQYRGPFIALSDEATDKSLLGCSQSSLSQSFSSVTDTYRYEFDDRNAPVPLLLRARSETSLGAYHGSELQYLFDVARLPGPKSISQEHLAERMLQYWGNFVRTGNPNSPGLVEWPRYEPSGHRLLSFRPTGDLVIDNFDMDHHCAFWAAAQKRPSH